MNLDYPLQILTITLHLQGFDKDPLAQTMASAAGEDSFSNLSRSDHESEGQGGLVSEMI